MSTPKTEAKSMVENNIDVNRLKALIENNSNDSLQYQPIKS